MAKDTTKEIAKKEVDKISKSAEINEAYFVGLLWADPFNHFSEYSDTISMDEFIHDVWGFYYELGRRMYEDGVKTFDDITVHTKVKEYNVMSDFEEYGKMSTIDDAVSIVKENADNISYYYETIKKNYVIRQLFLLFGEKVLIPKGKYDFNKMTREQLSMYWQDKINKISLDNVNRYEAENLYIDADEFIRKLEEESADMLPYYKSFLLNSISQGVPRGHVTMIGGFGGTGKSSITAEKFVMSCIANREKTIVVLNEEDAQSFRQKIVLSILFHEFGTGFDRKRMVNGKLKEEDKVKIRQAFAKMNELIDENEGLIKVIFMEKYVMKDLEKIVRFWSNRGYTNLLIDTHKVSDESKHEARWQTFVEDMKAIYRWTRKNAGGMNLRTVVTFQLADSAIKNRYLDFEAIGEGKASKNEASIMYMFRVAWSDEYEDGKRELECWKNVKNELTGQWDKKPFKLEKGKIYYLWFTPKNRFGKDNDTGQPVLVIEPNFNSNAFYEIGWTFVANDKSGR
ncbi:replicative DNA helicase [Bacillus phage vB_BcoS-136]|uniref:Replicative DNA helicase n=1 Tax=Bacillus phage vB_BcoS-136 TaxID=2419619 RepID=A0A3G3BVR0_9CAUD|nr:replicative DNA helicase [Bacillus phage vB_BcoS-136]AYP68362.1 replicative DNA helicase [Bacillus phage vB_BcoS-136]